MGFSSCHHKKKGQPKKDQPIMATLIRSGQGRIVGVSDLVGLV